MITEEQLNARLRDWANEYRGGRYENVGWNKSNILATVIQHQGFVPDSQIAKRIPISTAADEIECAVLSLLKQNYRSAWVLRVEYLRDHEAEQTKLEYLRRIGLGMSRAHYYEMLRLGKAFVSGYIVRFEPS